MTADEDDFRRASAGDPSAFEALIRRHFGVARAIALAVTAEPADADDVLQDAFVTAWDRLAQCRTADGFRPWLLRIVRNTALNHLDRRRVRATAAIDAAGHVADAASPAADAEHAELARALTAALAQLPDMRREIVLLHDLEGFTHAEIAALVGTSELMSRQHLSDARRTLRGLLASYRKETSDG